MRNIIVSAPGKIHLLGEHSVVYGKPAIITALNKRCFVEITQRKDKDIEIFSQDFKIRKVVSGKEILEKTKEAKAKWKAYTKNNNIALLRSITADRLDFSIIAIGETLMYLKKTIHYGFKLSIKSDIPVGVGMGSSAALSVCIAGAISTLLTRKIDKEAINEIAFLSEQKKHGFPSGGDNTACCFGGLIWYRKETPDFKIIKPIPFVFPKKIAKNFVVINTGIPAESTGEMVSIVRNLYKEKQRFVESVLSRQEKLTRELLSAIKDANDDLMTRIIREGEKNLEHLGVVSKSSQTIIRSIERLGGAAKICGGGGKSKASGIVLAYRKNPELLKDIAKQRNLHCENIILGEEGIRQELS